MAKLKRSTGVVNLLHLTLLSAFLLVLSACGGGGGGGGGGADDEFNPPPDLDGPDSPGIPDEANDGTDNRVGGGDATVSGSISIANNSFVDNDTADDNQADVSNDTLANAQEMPNPATVGGYASFVNGSNSNNGCDNGGGADGRDLFAVELFENQVIELIIADLDRANSSNRRDLDLFLVNDEGFIIDGSLSANSNESLIVDNDGEYFILVCAFSGSTNYTLAISQGNNGFTAQQSSMRLSAPVVANQATVEWADMTNANQQPSKYSNSKAKPSIAAMSAMNAKVLLNDQQMSLIEFASSATSTLQQKSSSQSFSQISSQGFLPSLGADVLFANVEQYDTYQTLQNIKLLQNRDDVSMAEPNLWRQTFLEPNDTGFEFQWHYPMISLPEAWDTTTGQSSVLVAVIDTGVLLAHPDLANQFDSSDPNGFDFISNPAIANDGNGIDGNANDVGDRPGNGSSFHGTHVAGTVAAATNNSNGVSGVGWNVSIMPLRVLGEGGGTSFDVRQAVLYAAGLPSAAPNPPAQRADVINLSLGGGGFSQSEQNAYTAARNEGVIIVAAAGNEATSQPSYPAAYDGVVSVSAVTQEKLLAPYSNFGNTIDVAAPGGNTAQDVNGDGFVDGVLSTGGNDTSGTVKFVYPFFQGTSMAAPHVAGVVALMKSVHPDMTPAEFDQLLSGGMITDDLGAPGFDPQYGNGLINARLAVQEAVRLAGGTPAPEAGRLRVDPRSLGFGAFATSQDLNAENTGNGPLAIISVTDDASWLTVTPSDVEAGNLGRYTATVDRTGLADGAYSANITFDSSANDIVVPVIMQVGDFVADAGVHYVLLQNDNTGEIVGQQIVTVNNGQYNYEFTEVPDGEYRIAAGSDYDDDATICDQGEACGAYLTVDQPVTFLVDGADVTGLDFTTGYEASFNAEASGAEASTPMPIAK